MNSEESWGGMQPQEYLADLAWGSTSGVCENKPCIGADENQIAGGESGSSKENQR